MKTVTNAQIAGSLELWDEYYNTSALMTDAEFEEMSYAERLAMLERDYPDSTERSELSEPAADPVSKRCGIAAGQPASSSTRSG